MYTEKDYPSKKALIEDFKAGVQIRVFQPGGMFPSATEGKVSLEGPHYPKPHKWYATATISNGIITSVK